MPASAANQLPGIRFGVEPSRHGVAPSAHCTASTAAFHDSFAKSVACPRCTSTVSFSVTDDGCGFDPETAPGPKQGHFGLLGIRERIEDFNGELKIASAPDHGAKFTVTLTAPDERGER